MNLRPKNRCKKAAFTLTEVLIAMGIAGIALIAVYAGTSFGMAMTKQTREDLRATQLIMEKLELLRLYNWDQLCEKGTFTIPKTFVDYFDPNSADTNKVGVRYSGTITIEKPPFAYNASYTNDMKLVTITVSWNNGKPRSRQMQSHFSRYGLQRYIYVD